MISRGTNHKELGRNGIDDLFVKRRSLGGSHDDAIAIAVVVVVASAFLGSLE